MSEVIPGKEPDVDGLLPALLEVVRCVFKCFFVLSCFGVNSLQVCLGKSFYSIESTYIRLYGQWAPHLAELHEG